MEFEELRSFAKKDASSGGWRLVIAVMLVVAVLLGGLAWWYLGDDDDKKDPGPPGLENDNDDDDDDDDDDVRSAPTLILAEGAKTDTIVDVEWELVGNGAVFVSYSFHHRTDSDSSLWVDAPGDFTDDGEQETKINHHLFESLEADTVYEFRVNARFDGLDDIVQTISIRTESTSEARSEYPTIDSVMTQTDALIWWTVPSYYNDKTLSVMLTTTEIIEEKDVDKTSYLFTDLTPNTEYTMWLYHLDLLDGYLIEKVFTLSSAPVSTDIDIKLNEGINSLTNLFDLGQIILKDEERREVPYNVVVNTTFSLHFRSSQDISKPAWPDNPLHSSASSARVIYTGGTGTSATVGDTLFTLYPEREASYIRFVWSDTYTDRRSDMMVRHKGGHTSITQANSELETQLYPAQSASA